MTGLEKFLVNGVSGYSSRSAFNSIRQHLTLPSDSHILELGAGTGALSRLIYEYYAPRRLVVTDYDPAQLEEAKIYLREKLGRIPENVELRAANALNLSFEDESFDTVFAMHVLHHTEKREWHFKNIPNALAEIQRVLRSGGVFVYGETFKKKAIREYLNALGCREIFSTRHWRITDFCIYKKLGDPSEETPERLLQITR